MAQFDDAPGVDYAPPSPLYPVDRLINPAGVAQPASGMNAPGGTAAASSPPIAPGPPLPISPPAQAAGGTGALNLGQILGALAPRPQGGMFGPNTGRVMSALGAGLSSAGQNWNKPALAAFASGAGAALQGGQQFDNHVQDARLKALHAAIAAWKVGDMAAFHQAATSLRALTAQQQQRAAASSSAAPPGSAAAPANNPPSVTGNASGPTEYGGPPPVTAAPPPAAANARATRLSAQDAFAQARSAVARGAPHEAVRQRLADNGYYSSAV